MPARSSRPLFSAVLALTIVALFALLFTAIAIERATPEELAVIFHLPTAPEASAP